tara:strand:- start:417 stop:653 length:237 start_codon:yes stop_codon:yes gene_type:complete
MTQRANDFIIWRAGSSVNWECTAQDIAEETGFHPTTVWKTCKRRGWDIVHGDRGNLGHNRMSVDTIMANPYLQNHGHN